MKSNVLLPIAAATFGGLLATSAMAQTNVFTGTGAAEDRIEDLREDIDDDLERDVDAFGTEGRRLGFDGSLALRGSATSGNTDSSDLGIGADLGFYDGLNGYQLQMSYDYSEDDDEKSEESFLYDLEYRRNLSPDFYGFVQLQGTIDEFSSYESDTFLGFGVGYRIYNTNDMIWTAQAGLGYRYADLQDVDALDDFEEPAVSIGSEFFRRLNDTTYVSNDTDIVWSETDTVVFNDLGFTVAMSDTLALRTSLLTEWHSDPFSGRDDFDNRYGISLVYNLN
jgi:putative salt-induced outer membrane protein